MAPRSSLGQAIELVRYPNCLRAPLGQVEGGELSCR